MAKQHGRIGVLPSIPKDKFLKLQIKYCTDAKLAEELGVTRQAIYAFKRRNKIRSCSYDKNKRNGRIYREYKEGRLTVELIADKYGLSVMHTYKIIRTYRFENGLD